MKGKSFGFEAIRRRSANQSISSMYLHGSRRRSAIPTMAGMTTACSKQLTLCSYFVCATRVGWKQFSSSRSRVQQKNDNFPLFAQHTGKKKQKFAFLLSFKATCRENRFFLMLCTHWKPSSAFLLCLSSHEKGFSAPHSTLDLFSLCNHTNVEWKRGKIFSRRFHNSSMTWNGVEKHLERLKPSLVNFLAIKLSRIKISSRNFLPALDYSRSVHFGHKSKTSSGFIYNASEAENLFLN